MYLKRDFFKSLSKIGGATLIAQLIGIVTVPIFARLFPPNIIGEYALFTSAIGILGIFTTGRYEYALMLPKREVSALGILIGASCISILWFFLLYIFLYFGKDFLLRLGDYQLIAPYIVLLPVFVLLASLIRVLQYWSIRRKEFGFNAKISLFNSIFSKFGNIVLGYCGFISFFALILMNLLVQLTEVTFRFYGLLKKETKDYWREITVLDIRQELIRYKRFPLLDIWNGFLDTGSLLIVPILLSFYFSTTDVGLYSQSLTLIQLPLVLIASAFGQVFFQRLGEANHSGELSKVIAEAIVFLFLLSFPIFSIIGFWGKELFIFMLGERWALSGTYAELLAPWCCLKMVFSPLSTIFSVKERQDISLIITITTLLTRVLAIVIGGFYNSCYLSILLFGVSGVIVNLLGIFFLFHLSKITFAEMKFAVHNNVFVSIIRKIV